MLTMRAPRCISLLSSSAFFSVIYSTENSFFNVLRAYDIFEFAQDNFSNWPSQRSLTQCHCANSSGAMLCAS